MNEPTDERQLAEPPAECLLDVKRSTNGREILIKLAGGHLLADGHLVISPGQARGLARHLIDAANEAELAARLAREHAGPSGRP